MNVCKDRWSKWGILSEIERHKLVCIETTNKQEFEDTKRKYNECIENKKGAIFMAALRGKVSEGIDFADMYGRAVLIIGIPHAFFNDIKVKFKRNYLDERRQKDNSLISGDDWYKMDALKAVNQAIGRVIRHVNDYGAILFCDERFNDNNNKKYISSWVKDQMVAGGMSATLEQLKHFYKKCTETVC